MVNPRQGSRSRPRRPEVALPPWLGWIIDQVVQGAFQMPPGPVGPKPETVLLDACPPETLKRIWRVIVQDLHPDRGGNPEKMTQANIAWGEIKRRRGIR